MESCNQCSFALQPPDVHIFGTHPSPLVDPSQVDDVGPVDQDFSIDSCVSGSPEPSASNSDLSFKKESSGLLDLKSCRCRRIETPKVIIADLH